MLHVTAAVLQHRGRVLLARRTDPEWLAGKWEFPGGKIEQGEDPREALARELSEELDLAVTIGAHLTTTRHAYPELTLELSAFLVDLPDDLPAPELRLRDHDRVAWLDPLKLGQVELAAADLPIVAALLARIAPRP
jgi:8-oxo-dGTP diphosphatase